jgi:hypothetical protein
MSQNPLGLMACYRDIFTFSGVIMPRKRGEILTKFWSEISNGKGHLENLGIDGRRILKCSVNEWDLMLTGFIGLKMSRVTGSCDTVKTPWFP